MPPLVPAFGYGGHAKWPQLTTMPDDEKNVHDRLEPREEFVKACATFMAPATPYLVDIRLIDLVICGGIMFLDVDATKIADTILLEEAQEHWGRLISFWSRSGQLQNKVDIKPDEVKKVYWFLKHNPLHAHNTFARWYTFGESFRQFFWECLNGLPNRNRNILYNQQSFAAPYVREGGNGYTEVNIHYITRLLLEPPGMAIIGTFLPDSGPHKVTMLGQEERTNASPFAGRAVTPY